MKLLSRRYVTIRKVNDMTTEINVGRKTRRFEVTEMDMSNNVLLTADLIARGFDGKCYILTGDRGAVKMAYRSAATGKFEIVA